MGPQVHGYGAGGRRWRKECSPIVRSCPAWGAESVLTFFFARAFYVFLCQAVLAKMNDTNKVNIHFLHPRTATNEREEVLSWRKSQPQP